MYRGGEEFAITGIERISTLDDLKRTVVATRDGTPITLSQLAEVKLGPEIKRGDEGPVSHLEAETGIKEIGSFNAVVSLKVGEKRENFRFGWTPASHAHN